MRRKIQFFVDKNNKTKIAQAIVAKRGNKMLLNLTS